MTRTLPPPLLAAIGLVCLAVSAPAARGQSYFWTGGSGGAGVSGDWNSQLWTLQGSPNQPGVGPPPSSAAATISIGNSPFTVTVSDAEAIGSLTVNNLNNATLAVNNGGSLTVGGAFTLTGTLAVNTGGALTVNGAFNFNNGTLNNTGNGLTLNGAFNWAGGSITGGTVVANFGGSVGGVSLAGGNMTFGGTNQSVSWTGGTINLSGGSVLTIGTGVTVTKSGSLNPHIQLNSTGALGTESFVNAGTLVWTGNATTLTIDNGVLFNNTGTVRTTSGTVWVQGVATTSGAFDTGNSTSGTGSIFLNGGGTTAFNAGASVLGTGTFQIGGGISGSNTATLNAAVPASTLTLGGGTIQGPAAGTGAFNVSGPLTLAGGTVGSATTGGMAAVNATGGGLITSSTTTVTTGGVLNFNAPAAGTATYTWSGGTVSLSGTGAVGVGAGATLLATGNNGMTAATGTATLTIAGTFVKNGGTSGTTLGGAGLTTTNTGTIDVETGSLSLTGVINNTGTLTANTPGTGGVISVDGGGTLNLNTGSVVTGTGSLRLNSGTAVLNVNADTSSAAAFDVEGGTVQGTKTLTANGSFTWSGGTVGGTAAIKATNGGVVSGSSTVTTGFVELAGGSFGWAGGNIVLNGTGTLLKIDAGVTLTNTTGNAFQTSAGNSPVVQNNGTFAKITAAGSVPIPGTMTFNNAGTVQITSGSIGVAGAFNNTGTITVANGATLSVNPGVLNLNGGSVTGAGTIRIDGGGTMTIPTGVTVPAGTTLDYVRGTITGAGVLNLSGPFNFALFDSNSVSGSVTVNASGGGSWTGGGTPRISTGTVNLTGLTTAWSGADITFTNSGALGIASGATLQLNDDHGITVTGGTPSVSVGGTYLKAGGTGTSTIPAGVNLAITSTGVLDVESGTVTLRAPTANAGTIQVGATTAGALTFDQATTLTGTGQITVGPVGTLNVNLPTAATTITVPAGMTFANSGTVLVTQGTFKIDPAAVLSNYTAGTLTGGTWQAQNAVIDFGGRPVGTIAATAAVELTGSTASVTGLTALTQVNGKLRLVAGATVTPVAAVNVSGTVEASGTLGTAVTVQSGGTLTGSGTVNGIVTVQSGGAVAPGPGPYAAPGTAQLTVGTTNLNGGSQYVWELNSWVANPSAGGQYDQLRGTSGAKLNLAGASNLNPVTIKIVSLNGTAPGLLPNFDPAASRSWVIADFSNGNGTNGVQSFNAGGFVLDTSTFANAPGTTQFALSTDLGTNQLLLTYNPVPEPLGAIAVAALALAAGVRRRRISSVLN
jgi:hypothetical protein